MPEQPDPPPAEEPESAAGGGRRLPVPASARRPAEISPFGAPPDEARGRRVLRGVILAAIPVAALVTAYLATRNATPPAASTSHDHGAAGAGGADSGRPVLISDRDAQRIGVTFTVATVGPVAREIRTVGQVTFDETRVTSISPKVDGWVERLFVNFTGQAVSAGDPLLSVYSPMLVTAQEELLLATRLQTDVGSGTPAARQNADDLVAAARRRLAYWDVPESEIARIERTGQVQRTITLRAPVRGVVVEKHVLQGQRITAGTPLYRIADLGTVWVEGEVFEQDLPAVRLGLPTMATFEALPGEERRGRITYIYPTLNPETRTARVRVELPNPGLRLKPGMYATFHLTGAARESVLTVPRSAVLATGERSLVFVRRPDGMLEPREVAVGKATDERVEVLRGLAAGDTVVASATFLVDAESNLRTQMGGMGNMPGMDMTAPTKADTSRKTDTAWKADTPRAPARGPTAPAPVRPAPAPPDDAGHTHPR